MTETEKAAVRDTLKVLAQTINADTENENNDLITGIGNTNSYRGFTWVRFMLLKMGHSVAINTDGNQITLVTINFKGTNEAEIIEI